MKWKHKWKYLGNKYGDKIYWCKCCGTYKEVDPNGITKYYYPVNRNKPSNTGRKG